MGATRFTVILERHDAGRAFSAFDRALEDEGLPIGIRDVEEDGPLQEIAVYAEAEGIRRVLKQALAELQIDAAIEEEVLPDIDWVARSLEGLKPVRAGRFLVHGSHDRDKRRPNDLAIEIEAGQAFGTGHHGTTAGCLEMIAAVARAEHPRKALDLGTGSAVLAIALAKLRRIPILATDIDPIAVRVARENIRLNGVEGFVAARHAAGFNSTSIRNAAPFDLIVANILARPLMRMAPEFAGALAVGGSVVLSGILARQRWPVIAAFTAQGLRHVRTLLREGWTTIHLKH